MPRPRVRRTREKPTLPTGATIRPGHVATLSPPCPPDPQVLGLYIAACASGAITGKPCSVRTIERRLSALAWNFAQRREKFDRKRRLCACSPNSRLRRSLARSPPGSRDARGHSRRRARGYFRRPAVSRRAPGLGLRSGFRARRGSLATAHLMNYGAETRTNQGHYRVLAPSKLSPIMQDYRTCKPG